MYLTSLARIAQKVLALVVGTATVLVFTTGMRMARHDGGVSIHNADWDGITLTANGRAEQIPPGGPVQLVDAATGAVIGTDTTVKKNHRWAISTSTCAENVFARQDGVVSPTIPVTGTPCGGQCTYNPPTFSMGADQTIAPDGSAVYTLSVTNNDTASCPTRASTWRSTAKRVIPAASACPRACQPGQSAWHRVPQYHGNPDRHRQQHGADGDALTSTVTASDNVNHAGQAQSDAVTTTIAVAGAGPTARGDTYATPIGKTLNVAASRVSGVLYNDFGGTGPLTAVNLDTAGTQGSVTLNADGSFNYTPPGGAVDNQVDTFTYQAQDALGDLSAPAIVSVQILSDQPDYKMTMNYELGMHCTGFEFAYCCVLPPYNSIVAQITKPQTIPTPNGRNPSNPAAAFPRLLDASDTEGRPAAAKRCCATCRSTAR